MLERDLEDKQNVLEPVAALIIRSNSDCAIRNDM
jgi:hypothetical protein